MDKKTGDMAAESGLMCWVNKMVIPVYRVSEGEALCDWIH